MTKSKQLTNILILFLAANFFIGCSGDDSDDDNLNTQRLFDKWWYDSNDFAADVYFHSNGDYEQKIILLNTEFAGSGNWEWIDEEAGLMRVEYTQGQGQLLTEANYRFSNIRSNSMTIQLEVNGAEAGSPVNYLDTDQ